MSATTPCCEGYGEHFEWCELGQLEESMRRRGVITYDPPAPDTRSHLERFWTDGTVGK